MSGSLAVGLVALGTGTFTAVLFVVLAVALAPFARIQVQRVGLGFGPRIYEGQLAGVSVLVRLFPFNSYIDAEGQSLTLSDADLEDRRAVLRPGRRLWREASPLRRVSLVLVYRAIGLAIALVVLGPARTARAFVTAIPDAFSGALGTLQVTSRADVLLDQAATTLTDQGPLVLAAVVLCKWAALSVLALPGDLINATRTRRPAAAVRAVAPTLASLALYVVLFASWTICWLRWALS